MPKIYPIGGGKGGVGKSFITACLGALIARKGNKVAVIDLDLGTSNLHTFLGIKNPQNGINSFLNKTVENLERTVVPTLIPNLFFISSSHCSMEIANLFYAQKIKIIRAIRKLPFDYVLIDLGAGTNFNTLDFFLTSNQGVFVCTPEPTSIENTFRFIKAVYLRRLKQIIKNHAFKSAVKDVVFSPKRTPIQSTGIIEIVLKYDPQKEQFLKDKISKLNFRFILNQFRKNLDATLGEKVETVCNRHFYSNFQFLGNISYDARVCESIFSKKLYVQKYPHTTASGDLKKIADKITNNRPATSVSAEKS
jgi:flagellar biosynthesis protein FlhG